MLVEPHGFRYWCKVDPHKFRTVFKPFLIKSPKPNDKAKNTVFRNKIGTFVLTKRGKLIIYTDLRRERLLDEIKELISSDELFQEINQTLQDFRVEWHSYLPYLPTKSRYRDFHLYFHDNPHPHPPLLLQKIQMTPN